MSSPTPPSPTALRSPPAATRSGSPDGAHPRPKFPRDVTGFHAELRRRVEAYFANGRLSDRDCWPMYLKTAVILAWLATSYVLLVFVATSWWQAIPLAVALAGVARSQLYGVAPWDPVSVVGSAAAVLAIALLAAWIPAARAVRVTPAPALRHE